MSVNVCDTILYYSAITIAIIEVLICRTLLASTTEQHANTGHGLRPTDTTSTLIASDETTLFHVVKTINTTNGKAFVLTIVRICAIHIHQIGVQPYSRRQTSHTSKYATPVSKRTYTRSYFTTT